MATYALSSILFLVFFAIIVDAKTPSECVDDSDNMDELSSCLRTNYLTFGDDYVPVSNALTKGYLVGAMRNMLCMTHKSQCATERLPQKLVGSYRLALLEPATSQQNICVLTEADGADNGFGAFAVRFGMQARPVHVQVPHPLDDIETTIQGGEIFDVAQTHSVAFHNARRITENTTASTCQPTYFISDASHNVDNIIHLATRAVLKHYQNDSLRITNWAMLQLHGISSGTCVPDVYLTPARNVDTSMDAKFNSLNSFADTLNNTSPWFVALPQDSTCSKNGEQNVQGRLANGVAPASVCTTAATDNDATGHFIHMEQKKPVREDNTQQVANAVLTTWSLQNTGCAFLPYAPIEDAGKIEPPRNPDNADLVQRPEYETKDQSTPVNKFRALMMSFSTLSSTLQDAAGGPDPEVQSAYNLAKSAWDMYLDGSSGNLTYLVDTVAGLEEALQELINITDGIDQCVATCRNRNTRQRIRAKRQATVAARSDATLIRAVQTEIVEVVETLTSAVANKMLMSTATSGGCSDTTQRVLAEVRLGRQSRGKGLLLVAVQQFGRGLGYASNSLVFDPELFRTNIMNAMNNQVVGYSFAITRNGNLYSSDATGPARTAADPTQKDLTPFTRMHIASVSKPITTILVLRLLDQLGESPDTLVSDYLPSLWTPGAGMGSLRFRDFLTHHTGFAQTGVGSTYSALRAGIEAPIGPTGWAYSNANFGLMRVLICGLLGFDLSAFEIIGMAAPLAAAIFVQHAKVVFGNADAGLQGLDCNDDSSDETIQYAFPHGGVSGFEEPDRRLVCGGIGWHASAIDLAKIMAYLRNSEEFMSNNMRQQMQNGFLGFMDPVDWGWVDAFGGVPYVHGGDWFNGPNEQHGCVVAFPNRVEVSLLINSARGSIGGYQCIVLQNAYDNAWVPING
eukprot:m.118459 g.118459  ORF g.118459 m.118459 type:complete len:911 (+) comp14277_c1_seq21:245-2977(+)